MPTYEEYVMELGDLARERLWNKPSCPRSIDRVYKAEEQLAERQAAVKEMEDQIAEQDQALTEFRDACDAEFSELEVLVNKFKRSVEGAESKVRGLRTKLSGKEADLRYSKVSMNKEEQRVKLWEESGEGEKAEAGKENLKRMKLDVLRRQKEITEMREEMDVIMNPQSGIGSEGIRARRRIMDLEDQLTAREEDYERVVGEIQEQLSARQDELNAAQEYYDKSIAILGEDVYQARIPDPALSAIYPKLDRLVK